MDWKSVTLQGNYYAPIKTTPFSHAFRNINSVSHYSFLRVYFISLYFFIQMTTTVFRSDSHSSHVLHLNSRSFIQIFRLIFPWFLKFGNLPTFYKHHNQHNHIYINLQVQKVRYIRSIKCPSLVSFFLECRILILEKAS
jgi:hypothetical protein